MKFFKDRGVFAFILITVYIPLPLWLILGCGRMETTAPPSNPGDIILTDSIPGSRIVIHRIPVDGGTLWVTHTYHGVASTFVSHSSGKATNDK